MLWQASNALSRLKDRCGMKADHFTGCLWCRESRDHNILCGIPGRVSHLIRPLHQNMLTMPSRVGRRLPLLVGATMQATSMLYLALYIRFSDAGEPNGEVGGTPAGGIVGIIFIYIYAFGWSFGHSVAPYVVAAEIFPSRIVSVTNLLN